MIAARFEIERRKIGRNAIDAATWREAIARFTNFGTIYTPFIKLFREEIVRAFETEGKSTGNQWKALAKATIDSRGSAHPILQDSGDLLERLRTGQGEYVVKERKKLVFGTRDKVATYHQTGAARTKHGELPARPIFRITKPLVAELRRIAMNKIITDGLDVGFELFAGKQSQRPARFSAARSRG
jgi:phage gpG-like protein